MVFKNIILNRKILLMLLLFTSIILILNATTIIGHSPANLSTEYNTELNQLTVDFTHSVSNPDTHFIQTVTITQNDNQIISETYVSQPAYDSWAYVYEFTAIEGDEINVFAECNQGGSKSITYTVGEVPTQNLPTPSIFLSLAFLSITTLIYNLIRKRRIN